MSNIDPRCVFENSDPAYLASCLAQRQPQSGGAGSRFLKEMSLDELKAADWQPFHHLAVQAPAIAFKAPIPGRIGLVTIDSLAVTTELTLDDRKETGMLEVVYRADLGPEVAYTTLLVGPARGEDKLVVWTFFPGDPVMPSKLPAGGRFKHGDKITVAQATNLGFIYAKVE